MAKLLKVAQNGQISIGKEWAGKQITIERISSHELRILTGTFIPDKDLTFNTSEAKESLDDFNQWTEKAHAKKSDRKALMDRVEKKIREKNKRKTG